ncbi:MAG: hypothetical protein ACXWG1_17205 [Usitatibacter sp.]
MAAFGVLAAGCATPPPPIVEAPVNVAPAVIAAPARDDARLAEEAKALLAQAETDIQRARAKRALWLKAWEDLLAARQAVASHDPGSAIAHAKRASELAQLGLEQLAYPAVN